MTTTLTRFGYQCRTVDRSTRRLVSLGATGPAWTTKTEAAERAHAVLATAEAAGHDVTDLALVRYTVEPVDEDGHPGHVVDRDVIDVIRSLDSNTPVQGAAL